MILESIDFAQGMLSLQTSTHGDGVGQRDISDLEVGCRRIRFDDERSVAGAEKRRAWFSDQYHNPHESKHTFGEVLRWFDEAGIRFVRGIPAMRPDDDGMEGPSLFEPQPRGTALDHLVVQATQILGGRTEGGFFIMIGRIPADSAIESPSWH